MAAGYADFIATLEQADFFVGVLPFVIIYSIFYIALINAPKFRESHRITTLVAASFGFLGSFFILRSPFYQQFFINYFGFLGVGLLGVIGLITALMLTGFRDYFNFGQDDASDLAKAVGGIAAVIVLGAFVTAGGFGPISNSTGAISGLSALIAYVFNTGLIWAVVVILVLAVGLGSDIGEDEQENTPGGDD